jgi:DNA-binding MarR family transcriptional regulator
MEQTAQTVSVAARNAARDLKILITRLRRQLREVASTDELTASQVSMLTRLAILGESSTSELAGAERVRPQSMAAIVKSLEEYGLIQRTDDPDDGRRQILTLTPLGLERALGAQATWDEWLANALQVRYTKAERTTIVEALALFDRLVEF